MPPRRKYEIEHNRSDQRQVSRSERCGERESRTSHEQPEPDRRRPGRKDWRQDPEEGWPNQKGIREIDKAPVPPTRVICEQNSGTDSIALGLVGLIWGGFHTRPEKRLWTSGRSMLLVPRRIIYRCLPSAGALA